MKSLLKLSHYKMAQYDSKCCEQRCSGSAGNCRLVVIAAINLQASRLDALLAVVSI